MYLLFILSYVATSSLMRFEKNILGEWISEDFLVGNQPVLFRIAHRNTPMTLVLNNPHSPIVFHSANFHFGEPGNKIVLPYRLGGRSGQSGVAGAAADLFTVMQTPMVVALARDGRLSVELAESLIPTPLPTVTWSWGAEEIESSVTILDIEQFGISFPSSARNKFQNAKEIDGFVWLPIGSTTDSIFLGRAELDWNDILLPEQKDMEGVVYRNTRIVFRTDIAEDVYVGNILLRSVKSVNMVRGEVISIQPRVSGMPPVHRRTLRHLPLFHPPIIQTNGWGDTVLRLYPARYDSPEGLEGVIIILSDGRFKFLGPETTLFEEIRVAGVPSADTSGWTVKPFWIDGFYMEQRLTTYHESSHCVVVRSLKDGYYQFTLNRELDTTPGTDADAQECSICFEPLDEALALTLKKCKHGYHAHCVREWATKKTTCPICRACMLPPELPDKWIQFRSTSTVLRQPVIPHILFLAYLSWVVPVVLSNGCVGPLTASLSCAVCAVFVIHQSYVTNPMFQQTFDNMWNKTFIKQLDIETLSPDLADKVRKWARNEYKM